MFKILTFRSDGAFRPLTERSDCETDANRPGAWLARLAATPGRIAAALVARRAMRSLASLDDRMLRDIGIERGQIGNAVHYGRDPVGVERARIDVARWS